MRERQLATEQELDAALRSMYRTCSAEGSPVCLENALATIFGSDGSKTAKDLATMAMDARSAAKTPEEVWTLYNDYLKAWKSLMGNNATMIVEYQVFKEIELLGCTGCPVYKENPAKLCHK